MLVRRELDFGRSDVAILGKEILDVTVHREAELAWVVFPDDVDAGKFLPIQIFSDCVVFIEDGVEMFEVAFANALDAKVIDDEAEYDGL